MSADVKTLVADPSWLPDAVDPDRNLAAFVRAPRPALSAAAFLDARMTQGAQARAEAPLDAILAAIGALAPPAPANFIFHTAFCCSTLLSRALDREGANLSLKEPNVLMTLANARRVSQRLREAAAARAVSAGVFALLARPHAAGERILVKPTNPANNLLADAAQGGGRVLLLYSGLRSFLVSVLKKGEEGRAFVRTLYNIFALDPEPLGQIPQRQAMGFTDLQVAALVWRHQIELFARLLRTGPAERVRSLDCEALLARPAETLDAAFGFFGINAPAGAGAEIAAGPVFRKNAKFDNEAFDASQRAGAAQEIETVHAAALDAITGWAAKLKLGEDASFPLTRPLLLP